MKRFLPLLALSAFVVASSLSASAQDWRSARLTVAPDVQVQDRTTASVVEVQARIDEGIVYGHFNKPGGPTAPPNRDTYGYFDPQDPLFTVAEADTFAFSAFAGTVAGDDLYYFVRQLAGAASDSLGWYNYDTGEVGALRPISFTDAEGSPIDVADLPQWVDAGINTETGHMVLLGRARACTETAGGALYELDLATGEGQFMMQFVDPDACPLSGAYDNENARYVGLVPELGTIIQVDLTTGETVGSISVPDDVTIAQFIQSGATNYFVNDDPSDNEMWMFLFEQVGAGYQSTARRVLFDGSGVISGLENFGPIDETAGYVEVLTSGFKNMAPPPGGVANEPGAAPQAFAFVGVYPNPLSASATVMVRADEPVSRATVEVFDVLGRRVATLHDGALGASVHHLALDATGLPSGVYFVRIAAEGQTLTQRLTVAR